jgi:hypothetical protein
MRGWIVWVVGIVVGLVVLTGVVALVGDDDDSGETVSAAEWADSVCGTVLVWRGTMESIVDGVRSAGRSETSGSESGAESPQGRAGSVRTGVEQALVATETMVEGIARAGTPDTPNGEAAADGLESWANDAVDELEDAEDALAEDTDTTSDEIEVLSEAVGTIVQVYAAGGQAVADAAGSDPELVAAIRGSEKCEDLREEVSS